MGPYSLLSWFITSTATIVYDAHITIFRWGYKPTNISRLGAPFPIDFPYICQVEMHQNLLQYFFEHPLTSEPAIDTLW